MRPALLATSALLALAVCALAVSAPAARAEGTFEPAGTVGRGRIAVGIVVSAPGSGPTAGRGTSSPVIARFTTRVFSDDRAAPGDLSGLCIAGLAFGWEYRVITLRLDGTVVDDRVVCQPFTAGGPNPPAPVMPEPPTLAEVWAAARLPAPTIATDPRDRGITGLATRVATGGRTEIAVDATIRGYRIVGTATLVRRTLSIDAQPRPEPAKAWFTFETKGNHVISVRAVWRGTALLTGPGLAASVDLGDIGTATITATRIFPVHEVRSVLQP